MSTYNLTDQPIEDSFQPLLQIDSGSALRDGSGSLVDNIIVTSSYALTASFAENAGGGDTGSLLTTASFDNTDRNLTFTKGDSSTFSVNIPGQSGSVDWTDVMNKPTLVSGSSQIILQNTTGNLSGSRITGSVSNAVSASFAVTASYALNSQTIDTGSFATTGSNTFNGNQSINGILGVTMENEFDASFIGVSGSAGKTPRVNYIFTEYVPGDWDYRQTFTDIDFAYFRNDGGGMIFTAPNNDIKFISPTTNIWSRNLIIKDEIGGLPTNVILSGSLNISGNQLVTGLLGLVGKPNTTFDMYSDGGNYDTFKVQVIQNNGTRITDWDGSSYQTWLTIPTNTGSNPKPIFNRGLDITGSVDVNGDISLPYDGTQRNINVGVSGSDSYNIGGFDFDGKAYGSINSFATGGFQITNDATDSASSLNLRSNNGNINLTSNGFIINTINTDTIWRAQQSQYKATLYGSGFGITPTAGYTGSVFNATFDALYGMNLYNSSFTQDAGMTLNLNGVTSSGRNKIGFYSNYGGLGYQDLISFQDATNYTDGAIEFHQVVSGSSVTLSDTLTLTPVDPLPAGVVGNLAVSGSALYFYDGVWKQVSLV